MESLLKIKSKLSDFTNSTYWRARCMVTLHCNLKIISESHIRIIRQYDLLLKDLRRYKEADDEDLCSSVVIRHLRIGEETVANGLITHRNQAYKETAKL